MRGFLLGVALTTVALTTGAQSAPFPLTGWIDTPSPFVVNDYVSDFHITGWMLDCRDGQLPPFVAVLDHDIATGVTQYLSSYIVFRDLARPDVQAAVSKTCPLTSVATGYAVYPNTPLTPGLHYFSLLWSSNDGYTRSQITAVIVP